MRKVYASSDWHGCGYQANKILNYLQPEDKLYFLGDATDRGLQGADSAQRMGHRDRRGGQQRRGLYLVFAQEAALSACADADRNAAQVRL